MSVTTGPTPGALTPEQRHAGETIGRILATRIVIAGGIAVPVILSVTTLSIINYFTGAPRPIPEVLANWGGVVIRFYFGQFVNLLKDHINVIYQGPAATRPSGPTGTTTPPSPTLPPSA